MRTPTMVATMILFAAAFPAAAQTAAEAQAMLAAQKWEEAGAAFESLLKSDPNNANYRFGFARAEQGKGDCGKAVTNFKKALAAGYQPEATARLQIARCYAKEGKKEATLAELERMARTRNGPYTAGPTSRIMSTLPEFEGIREEPRYKAAADRMIPCNLPEHRQFDFWTGNWEIHLGSPDGPLWGTNRIELINDGCTLHENAQSAGGYIGQSFSFYDAQLKKWHQTWIDYLGYPLYLDGGLNEQGEMVMTDAVSTPGTINRTTWSPRPDGLRHHWETSTDDGKTWATAFDGYYSKAEPAESR